MGAQATRSSPQLIGMTQFAPFFELGFGTRSGKRPRSGRAAAARVRFVSDHTDQRRFVPALGLESNVVAVARRRPVTILIDAGQNLQVGGRGTPSHT